MPKTALKSRSRPPAIDVEILSDAPAIIETSELDPIAASWQRVRRYHGLAGLHLAASTAAQVLAGMELIDLHQSHKGRGRRSDLSHDGTSWDDRLTEAGVTRTTAYRWMDMAKAARKRLAKDNTDLAALLDQPPAAMTEIERETLKRAVHKITDGATQSEFMFELGITRGKVRPKGGNLGGERTVDTRTPAEILTERAREKTDALNITLEEVLLDSPFHAAPEESRRRLHGLLVDLTAALKATL